CMIFYHYIQLFLHFVLTATTFSVNFALSLHDALPICALSAHPAAASARRTAACCARRTVWAAARRSRSGTRRAGAGSGPRSGGADRKSTRLNSSHDQISYAVFCLKKKTNQEIRS